MNDYMGTGNFRNDGNYGNAGNLGNTGNSGNSGNNMNRNASGYYNGNGYGPSGLLDSSVNIHNNSNSSYLGPGNYRTNSGANINSANSGTGSKSKKKADSKADNDKSTNSSGAFKKVLVASLMGLMFGLFGAIGFFASMEIGRATGIIKENTSSDTQTVASVADNNSATVRNNRADIDAGDSAAYQEDIDDITGTPDEVVQANVSTLLNATYRANVINDVSSVVEECMPCIVSITSTIEYNYYFYTNEGIGKGSGIIVGSNDDELLIATNYHVVEDNKSLSVTFCDNTEVEAVVKGTYEELDLAVVSVAYYDIPASTQEAIKIAQIGDSDSLKVGEPAIAIGNALGYGQSVTTGVISAVNCEMDFSGNGEMLTYIQTDAAINQGNSGGALLNIAGQVIGINSNKLGGSAVEGMGYAIPMSVAKPVIEQLMLKETRRHLDEDEQGCLGISGVSVTPQEQAYYNYPAGVYVANVFDDSAADVSGIQEGDFIYEFNGENINSMEQLKNLLSCYGIGENVVIKVYRSESEDYSSYEFNVVLGDKDDLEY